MVRNIGLLRCWLLLIVFSSRRVVSYTINSTASSSSSRSTGKQNEVRKFPNQSTPPLDVLKAQLLALQEGNLNNAYHLFSRARRLQIDDSVRTDMRESARPDRIESYLGSFLSETCPGIINHDDHRIVTSLTDPDPTPGRIPTMICRVAINGGSRHFTFSLTRQSTFDGGDPRDNDGYERCWFVWSIKPDDDGRSKRKKQSIKPEKPLLERKIPVPA